MRLAKKVAIITKKGHIRVHPIPISSAIKKNTAKNMAITQLRAYTFSWGDKKRILWIAEEC